MSAVDLQDIKDRSAALGLPGAECLQEEDLHSSNLSQALLQLCGALADHAASNSASAKLAAKQLHAVQSDCVAFDRALQQLDKAVCGPALRKLDRPKSLKRLIAHAQARRLTDMRKRTSPQASSAAQAPLMREANTALSELAASVKSQPGNHAADQLEQIHERLQSLLDRLPDQYFQPLVPEASLTTAQKQQVEAIFSAMQQEYAVRRKLLVERTKVTLQSMLWFKELLESRGTVDQALAAAKAGQGRLSETPGVVLGDVFQARVGDILAVTSKATSGDKGKFEATVKSIIIGHVPDRGGRPAEGREAAAAASMPSWAPRSNTGNSGNQGGGGKRGRGGGRGRNHGSGGQNHGSGDNGHKGGRGQHSGRGRSGRGRVQGGWHRGRS